MIKRVGIASLVVLGLCWFWTIDFQHQEESAAVATLPVEILTGDDSNYTRALAPRLFSFPKDHGPHDDYQSEWWYFTGNVDAPSGRQFGYELTFFRFAVGLMSDTFKSAWRTQQIYMAHFAVTDVANERFASFERFSRGAMNLAGASTKRFHVWLEDWSAVETGSEAFSLNLAAASGDISIDLALVSTKPLVLQGDRGYSQKSVNQGNASYYYSHTRMQTSGTIRLGSETHNVSGNSWMDREWSTSALAEEQTGWDWFAFQFADGRELMYYRMRRKDGGADPYSGGSLINRDGSKIPLQSGAVVIREQRYWISPRSGVRYPARWQLTVPEYDMHLQIEPLVSDQELDTAFRYWEGAVRIRGTAKGKPITGRGYVELAGYSKHD